MAQEVQRVRYFTGEFLQAGDFAGEQAYHIRMRYLHNRWLHTTGIAFGLEVTQGPGPRQVRVAPGMGLVRVTETVIPEFQGEDVSKECVLINQATVDIPGTGGQQSFVVVSFAEQEAGPVAGGNSRWLERPNLRALQPGSPVPNNETELILARVTLNAAGTGIQTIDLNDRRGSGMRGELEATRLRLPVTGVVNPAQWPTLVGGAANRADLTGNLNLLSGNITLAAPATVDGRRVSVDGATLDGHVGNMSLHVTNGNSHDHTGGDGAPIPFAAITAVPDILVKAHAVVLGTGAPGTLTPQRSFGVTSVVKNATGSYTVNWTTPVPNAVVQISLLVNVLASNFFYHITALANTSVTFVVTDTGGTAVDVPRFMVAII